MKRIFLISICIILCVTTLNINGFAQNVFSYQLTEQQMATALMLELYDENDVLSDTMTRAQFARMLFNSMGDYSTDFVQDDIVFSDVPSSHVCFKEINALYYLGIIKGHENKLFTPDEDITLESAVIMALRVLGYNDSFITNMSVSGKLTKGLHSEENGFSLYNAYVLIYNMLFADISDLYNSTKEVTYIGNTMGIYKIRGVVTDDGAICKTGASLVGEGKIVIDGTAYANATEYDDLFGQTVVAFYKYNNKIGENEIIYIYPIVERYASVLKGGNNLSYIDRTYTYYSEETDTEYTRTVSVSPIIVYNGKTLGINDRFTIDMMCPNNGYVNLYDNDRDGLYEVVRIYSFNTYVFDSYDAASKTILCKNADKAINLEDAFYTVENSSGELIEVTSIAPKSILSVASSIDGKLIKIIASNFSFTDKVESYDNLYVYTKGGGQYLISEYFKSKKLLVEPGASYTMYLDCFDELAYVEANVDETTWATGILLQSALSDEGLDDEYLIKILSVNKEEQVLKLASKVYVISDTDVKERVTAKIAFDNYINGYSGMVRYKYNIDEEITYLEFPLKQGQKSSSVNRLSLIAATDTSNADGYFYYNNIRYRSETKNLGGICLVSDNTSVIMTPITSTNDTEDYVFTSISSLTNNQRYDFKAYAFSPDSKVAKYLIINNQINSGRASYRSYTMAISDISYQINEKGDERIKLTGYVMGKEVSYFLKDNDVINKVTDMTRKGRYTIEKGDVVTINLINKEVQTIELLYASRRSNTSEPGSLLYANNSIVGNEDKCKYDNCFSWGSSSNIDSSSGLHYIPYFDVAKFAMVGYVYSLEDNVITITNQDLSTAMEFDTSVGDEPNYVTYSLLFSTSGATMVNYNNSAREMMRAADSSDIRTFKSFGNDCTKCLVFVGYGKSQGLFLLNY